jgi:transposase-like protein
METNLVELIERFGTEPRCRAYLEGLRWPNGIDCPRCHSSKISRLTKRPVFDCDACRYQFSVTAGTIFNDTHLPLWKWFLATYLICESKKGYSANQMKRTLSVSYKTAWFLCHRIRKAMVETEQFKLDGVVEVDETYVGGVHRGGKRGRGSENKEIVIGIRKRGGALRFFHAEDVKSGTLAEYIRENISEDVEAIVTDDLNVYPPAIAKTEIDSKKHKTINHSGGVYVMGEIHTNTVESAFSLLKRGIVGTWHKISAKHLPAYLDEMTFRFNRRDENSTLFDDTLRQILNTSTMTFERLTA